MNELAIIILLLSFFSFFFFDVEAQAPPTMNDDVITTFRPSLALVIGILAIVFMLTFLLLIYAKFCHRPVSILFTDGDQQHVMVRTVSRRFSGIDKTVIESLPFFRFSSLKGSRQGLECAVCLSKFEDIEILRLLPKCKHAFHIDCVDRWLESHSSCPLCRHKVDAEDLTIFTYSNSLRFSRNLSELTEDPNLELFVRREQDNQGSSRFSIGGSFRKSKKEELLIQEEGSDDDEDRKLLHKFKHRIIVSDAIFKNRWSDVNYSDLMFLDSEMLGDVSSKRFSTSASHSERFTTMIDYGFSSNDPIMKIKDEMERKRLFEAKLSRINLTSSSVLDSKLPSTSKSEANLSNNSRFLIPSGKRSMSEITNLSRFADFRMKNRSRESSSGGNKLKEERTRKLWIPIARRTVEWIAGREKSSQLESQNTRQPSNV